jgi:hypothetical protein
MQGNAYDPIEQMNQAQNMKYKQRPADDDDEEDGDDDSTPDDFDFTEYSEEHHLGSLSDFASYAKENKLAMKNMNIIVQLNILNSGSHFSEDKFNLAILYVLLLTVFVVLAFINYKKYQEDKEKFEEEDSPLYFTFGSLNMTVSHCMMKCIHNFYY